MTTITVAPTVEAGNLPPRIRLDVSDANLPAYFEANVVRNNPDGTTSPVRTTDGNPLVLTTSGANRIGIVYDYEAPYGAAVSYTTVESPATVSAQVTIPETRIWLVHPGVPDLSRPITVSALGPRTRAASQAVFQPIGRKYPVVLTDGQRKADSWELSVLTQTDEERDRLAVLLDDVTPLLLNVPATLNYGMNAEYVSVGEVTEERVARFIGNPLRTWSLPLTVVDRPVGGTQAERTFADLLAFPTFRDLALAYPTFLDVLTGP